jgi:hypothetical protein
MKFACHLRLIALQRRLRLYTLSSLIDHARLRLQITFRLLVSPLIKVPKFAVCPVTFNPTRCPGFETSPTPGFVPAIHRSTSQSVMIGGYDILAERRGNNRLAVGGVEVTLLKRREVNISRNTVFGKADFGPAHWVYRCDECGVV